MWRTAETDQGIHSRYSFWQFQASSPPTLHYACVMPIPLLQLQKKDLSMQRSRGFGQGVVVPKICYVQHSDCDLSCGMRLLPTNEIELLATASWSCRWSRNVRHVCLRNPIPPFLLQFQASTPYQKLEVPESGSTLSSSALCLQKIPSLRCSFRKKHLSHAEKQSVWSRSGLEAGLPAFQLPMFAKCEALQKRDMLDMFV